MRNLVPLGVFVLLFVFMLFDLNEAFPLHLGKLVQLMIHMYDFPGKWVVEKLPISAGMVLEDFHIVRQAEQARGFDPAGKSLPYKIRQYVMYMVPLFALSLRRSEEFTNALVARGYAFTGEVSKIKRADYICPWHKIVVTVICTSSSLFTCTICYFKH